LHIPGAGIPHIQSWIHPETITVKIGQARLFTTFTAIASVRDSCILFVERKSVTSITFMCLKVGLLPTSVIIIKKR